MHMGVQEEEEINKEVEKLSEKIIIDFLPNKWKGKDIQIHGAQRATTRMFPKFLTKIIL